MSVIGFMSRIIVPPFFETGVLILGAATLVHLVFIGIWGRLPRLIGWILTAAYGVFLYKGLIK